MRYKPKICDMMDDLMSTVMATVTVKNELH